jgi:dipeptidyl aminopeptidase/acylaminoacyl peptidase
MSSSRENVAGSLALMLAVAIAGSMPATADGQDVAATTTAPSLPARPGLIPATAFGKRPFMERPRLSPDGTRFAATVDVNGKPALAVMHLFDRAKEMRLIGVGDHEILWYRWAGNDRLLISLLMEGKYYGYDVQVSRLVMYQLSTQTPAGVGLKKQGFDGDDVIHVDDDGRFILLSASRDIEATPGVYRVSLDTLEMELVQKPREPITEWVADENGVVRGGYGYALGRLKFIYRDKPGDDFRVLANMRLEESEDEVDTFRVATQSDKGFVVTNARTGRFGLYEFDWKASEIGKPVFEHAEVDIDDFWMNEAGDGVEAVFYTDDRERVVWFDPELKELQEEIDKALPGRINWVTSASRDRMRFLIWTSTANDPGHYYFYDRSVGKLSRLATPYEALKDLPLAPVKYVSYRARDGLQIPAYLTMPIGREPEQLPLVLLPHGGPHARDRWQYDYWVQFLANRGYVVLQPNFRGSAGYGKEFLAKGFGQWGAGMQDDLTDAVKWLVADGTVDPKRICIMGASYGGYAALMGAIRTPDLFRCAISWAGVTDLNDMMRHDRNQLLPARYRNWRNRVRGEAEVDLRSVSPVHRAAEVGVPVLLMHGTSDDNVPYRQAQAFTKAMKKAGKPLEFIEFPDVGHNIDETDDRVRFLGAVDGFLKANNPPE